MADPAPRLRLVPDPRSVPRPPGRHVEPLWRQVLGRRMRRLRQDRGETLTETARRAGVSPQYLSEVERGSKDPSSEMVAAIAGALDVTLLDLTASVASDLAAPRPAHRAPGSTDRPRSTDRRRTVDGDGAVGGHGAPPARLLVAA